MLKIKYFLIGLMSVVYADSAFANKAMMFLQAQREAVVKEYILDLGQADYKAITNLFEKNGEVISTSRGKVNAKEFV